MKLIDADKLELYYGGLVYISPYDLRGAARYFMNQIRAQAPIKAIPCDYILDKAEKATGPESTYLRKLVEEWLAEEEG